MAKQKVTGGSQEDDEGPDDDPFIGNRHTGGKKGVKKPSKQLQAMRWVFENAEVPGEKLTWEQQQCRALQKTDRLEFMRMLSRLEQVQASLKRQTGASVSSPSTGASSDSRQGNVQDLIVELMEGMKGQTKQ